MPSRLPRDFFLQSTVLVARELLGKELVMADAEGEKRGIIIETEAYLVDDPASHSFKGQTQRNNAMYLEGGYSYVYFIYGRYYCLNAVTQAVGIGEGVLIRAVLPLTGLGTAPIVGPGKLCQAYGINLSHNGVDLKTSKHLWLEDTGIKPTVITEHARVGITKAADKLWNFKAKL